MHSLHRSSCELIEPPDLCLGEGWGIDDFDMGETTRPKIIIAFDDSFKTDLTVAFELMTNQGLKGTEYAVSSFVGQTDRLKQRDLNRMYASGWDICNHSATHPHMANMPESQVIGGTLAASSGCLTAASCAQRLLPSRCLSLRRVQ